MPGNGHLAAAFQPGQKAALGIHANAGGAVFQARQQDEQIIIVLSAFNAQRALAHGGQKALRVQRRHVRGAESQPVEPGGGQDDGVVVAVPQFAQPRVHIAAQAGNTEVRPQGQQLGLAPQAAGAHMRALRQGVHIGVIEGKETVGAGLARRHAAQDQPFGQNHGHILDAVHGQVRPPVQQGLFDFLHEQALAAHFGQGHVQNDVAPGLDHVERNRQFGVLSFQAAFDVLGLPESQTAAASGDDEMLAHNFLFFVESGDKNRARPVRPIRRPPSARNWRNCRRNNRRSRLRRRTARHIRRRRRPCSGRNGT